MPGTTGTRGRIRHSVWLVNFLPAYCLDRVASLSHINLADIRLFSFYRTNTVCLFGNILQKNRAITLIKRAIELFFQ
jgi:hypothetical protein